MVIRMCDAFFEDEEGVMKMLTEILGGEPTPNMLDRIFAAWGVTVT